MIQAGGFLFDATNIFGPPIPITEMKSIVNSIQNSIVSSYREELKNADPREINSNLLEDTGPNIIDKKIKKKKDFHHLRVQE